MNKKQPSCLAASGGEAEAGRVRLRTGYRMVRKRTLQWNWNLCRVTPRSWARNCRDIR